MQDIYAVRPVTPAKVLLAYPLVQAVVPAITPDRWERFCREQDQTGRGELLGVFDPRGYIRGIASVTLVDHTEYGSTLHVPMFVVLSIADPGGVVLALIAALKERALEAAAEHILITTDTIDGAAKDQLLLMGTPADKKTVHISVPEVLIRH